MAGGSARAPIDGNDMRQPTTRARGTHGTLLGAAMLVVWFAAGIRPGVAGDLTLRVHDAVGQPGGRIAVVLRTYASRPIGQGQLCMEATSTAPEPPPGPVASVDGAEVFSTAGDAVSDVTADLLLIPQQILLQFLSASATVNAADGPMAVYHLRLAADVQPGDKYELAVDVQGTQLIDEHGETVPIRPRNGTLTIRAPGDPIAVSAHAEDVVPGGVARLSVATFEPIALSSGQVGFRYDPAVASGPPAVSMDPRHGNASFVSSNPVPGLVIVSFVSPDGTLNDVPGDIVEFDLPTLPSVPPGTQSPVSLDPALTFLIDTSGQVLSLEPTSGVLEFAFPLAGAVSALSLDKLPGGMLLLDWAPDCGSGTAHAIYRGDLASGYDSLAFEPGYCDVSPTSATIAAGEGEADFFLVVPHFAGLEGSYGTRSNGDARPPAAVACFPQAESNPCAP